MIPAIEISLEEFKTGCINDETLQKAYELFTLHGVLLVKNVFMREFIPDKKLHHVKELSFERLVYW